MAVDTPPDGEGERFEDVDWETLDSGIGDVDAIAAVTYGAFAAYALLLLYDVFVLPPSRATIDVTVAGFGYVWDLTGVDWLFVGTLLVLFLYAIVPLARNRRLTAYYWRQFKKNKAAVLGLVFLIGIFLVGTIGTVFINAPEPNFGAISQPPVWQEGGSWTYPFGTTQDGVGVMKAVIFGMRVSMQVALIATLISMVIATAVGATAAYGGGWVDEVLMRYVDIQLTFPTFFLFLILVYLYGGSLFLLIVIFGLTGWGGYARIIRSEALQRNEEAYIKAAKSAGGSTYHVIRRHIVPNVSNSIITAATLNIPFLILAEAGLSFLGLGDPTVYSWGQTIAAGRGELSDAWWISTIPGVFLFLTILSFNFLGDALRDALDPRQETE
ncbi:ABC transporter permease [Halococcus agarilyticus]|uniref:ABC transporter permease n=1 Tax=Halococcus agarilyticus TaxID=1232219 RepID=UPI0006775B37|nr:ABC transporter permease [Halococcus agarilyticus]